MQRDDVRVREELQQSDWFAAGLLDFGRGNHRVVHEHAALEREQPSDHFATDPTEADDSDRQIAEGTHLIERHGQAPLARAVADAVRHDVASRRQQKGKRLIGDFVDAVVRHVADGNAPSLRRIEIDVIDADAVPNELDSMRGGFTDGQIGVK